MTPNSVPVGTTATNPTTGEKLKWDGSAWAKFKAETADPIKVGTTASDAKGNKVEWDGNQWKPLPNLAGRVKRLGQAIAPAAAGVETALSGARIGGEIGGPIGAVGGAVIGGAMAPFTERATQSIVTGDQFQAPSFHEVAKSAIINGVFSGAGEIGTALGAGKAAAVSPEIKAAIPELQTRASVQQAVRNREFWKGLGMNDAQITATLASPTAVQQAADDLYKATQTRQAFQTMVDSTRQDFNSRYSNVLGTVGKFEDIHADPGLIDILRDQTKDSFNELRNRMGPTPQTSKQFGGLPIEVVENLQNAIPKNASIEDLRAVNTQIRKLGQSPGLGNPAKAALKQIGDQVQTTIDDTLKSAGATPEQIGAIRGIDQDYGRWQDALYSLDPRSAKFSGEAANDLFDPMLKNPERAVELIKYAQKAEAMRPGEVMPQFRSAFLDKAIQEVKSVGGNDSAREAKAIGDLSRRWGGDKNTRIVLKTMFGDNSPVSNPDVLRQVVGSLSNPDIAKAKMASWAGKIQPPAWLIRLGVAYGLYSAITGSPTGPWTDMHKNPARFAAGMTGMILGTAFGGQVLSYGDRGLQSSYVDFVTNPNSDTLRNLGERLGAANTAIAAYPDSKN